MTFTHGDYSHNPLVKDKESVGETLFLRSLKFAPNQRAYLGLAILMQKRGDHGQAIRLLQEATRSFPQDEQLHTCLAISHMSLGDFGEAAQLLEKFSHSPTALRYLARCYSALGQRDRERNCMKKLKRLPR